MCGFKSLIEKKHLFLPLSKMFFFKMHNDQRFIKRIFKKKIHMFEEYFNNVVYIQEAFQVHGYIQLQHKEFLILKFFFLDLKTLEGLNEGQ